MIVDSSAVHVVHGDAVLDAAVDAEACTSHVVERYGSHRRLVLPSVKLAVFAACVAVVLLIACHAVLDDGVCYAEAAVGHILHELHIGVHIDACIVACHVVSLSLDACDCGEVIENSLNTQECCRDIGVELSATVYCCLRIYAPVSILVRRAEQFLWCACVAVLCDSDEVVGILLLALLDRDDAARTVAAIDAGSLLHEHALCGGDRCHQHVALRSVVGWVDVFIGYNTHLQLVCALGLDAGVSEAEHVLAAVAECLVEVDELLLASVHAVGDTVAVELRSREVHHLSRDVERLVLLCSDVAHAHHAEVNGQVVCLDACCERECVGSVGGVVYPSVAEVGIVRVGCLVGYIAHTCVQSAHFVADVEALAGDGIWCVELHDVVALVCLVAHLCGERRSVEVGCGEHAQLGCLGC